MTRPVAGCIASLSSMGQQRRLPGKRKISASKSPKGFPCGLPVAKPSDPTSWVSAKIPQNALRVMPQPRFCVIVPPDSKRDPLDQRPLRT